MIRGFANGCFDGMHDGQKHFLRECAMNCDRLFIAVNSDASVRALKGEGQPKNRYDVRALEVLNVVGLKAMIQGFNTEEELFRLIEHFKPDILFKGEDYVGKTVTGQYLVGRLHYVARHPGYVSTGRDWPKKQEHT